MSLAHISAVWNIPGLSPHERLVLLALADDARAEGLAYPSVARLCERTGMAERGIQGVVKRLSEAGHITLETGGGRGRANAYRLNFGAAKTPQEDAETPQPARGIEGENPAPHVENPAPERINPAGECVNPAPPAPQPYRTINEPLENHISPVGRAPKLEGFEEFWSVFPRKTAKGGARKAWPRALKLAPASQIIEAARRYAELRAGENPKYTAHPATWLNDERWTDEIPQPGGPGNGHTARPAPRQAAETERVDRALERARRRDVERGSGGNESARFGGMADRPDTDASPPLLRLAHG